MPAEWPTHRHAAAEIRFEENLLRRAALDRELTERQLGSAVSAAVSGGISWARIEELLGNAASRAHWVYEALTERAS